MLSPTTPQAQIEYLAEKIMMWKLMNYEQDRPAVDAADREDAFKNDGWHWYGSEQDGDAWQWQPLSDWNHWRQVEEKVMEDEKLWDEFLSQNRQSPNKRSMDAFSYMKADLPTRVQALISVHQELYPSPSPDKE